MVRHGLSRTRVYRVYRDMVQRCYNPNCRNYKYYGGLEEPIRICERWLGQDGFVNFFADMGHPPDKMSIERIDVFGDYSPDNCKWATRQEQDRNHRRTQYVECNGERRKVRDLADEYGIDRGVLFHRIDNGWDVEKALVTPINDARKTEYKGERVLTRTLVDQFNIPLSIFRRRIDAGWDVEKALTTPVRGQL